MPRTAATTSPRSGDLCQPGTLMNEMAVVTAKVKKLVAGRRTDGKVMRMWEAIETHMNRRQPLIIIAGADYGQGSSRDWRQSVRCGRGGHCRRGIERIHRTNLIGMGVLPLEFVWHQSQVTLHLDGTETYDVIGERTPRATLTLVVHRKNGERRKCRSRAD